MILTKATIHKISNRRGAINGHHCVVSQVVPFREVRSNGLRILVMSKINFEGTFFSVVWSLEQAC